MAGQRADSDCSAKLDRETFFERMIVDLANTLQNLIGIEHSRGYFSIVAAKIGDHFNAVYRREHQTEKLSRDQVAQSLVDLKSHIAGDFHIIEQTDERIVLGNRQCPFGAMVEGKPSLCMMTSNVFGRITAQNLGYAQVEIEESIALGHGGCRIVVWLRPTDAADPNAIEYFGSDNDD